MGWGAFITYTDLQIDGESENARAEAYGGVLTYRPDSNECNIDATYQQYKEFRLRTRLATINYDSESTSLYKNKAYDETNVRIIADYLF